MLHWVESCLFPTRVAQVLMLTQWNKYGYGSAAYKQVFNTAIRAAENANLLMSFALGANQGQGAPAKMESVGLAKELVSRI